MSPSLLPPASTLPAYARSAGRAVRLKIRPRPSNISESRKILGLLQNYGPIVVYQSLKYDPSSRARNAALVMFREAADADKLCEANPLRIQLSSSGARELGEGESSSLERDEGHIGEVDTLADPTTKDFHIRVDQSQMNFHSYFQRQHYAGSFDPEKNISAMYLDLQGRVPVSSMADCQLDKGEVPLRMRTRRLEQQKVDKRGVFREPLEEMWRKGWEAKEASGQG